VGYLPGTNPSREEKIKSDIRSGRSFGVSDERRALDPSTNQYLKEMNNVAKSADLGDYYRAIFRLLFAADPSGIIALKGQTQTAAMDFLTIYTAELDRNIMLDLNNDFNPWQVDLAEVTMLAAYVANAGMLSINGNFVQGSTSSYYLYNKELNEGGVGFTREDRLKLSAAISQYMWIQRREVTKNLAHAIGAHPEQQGDVIHQLGSLLNDPAKMHDVLQHADEITEAATRFLLEIADQSMMDNFTKSMVEKTPSNTPRR
jgi:hypothetical protein